MWKREKYVRVRLADLTFIEKTNHFPEDVLPSLQTHFWKFYCFWASAYDGAGEGPFSPCIIYPLHRMEPLEGQSHLELQPVWPEVSLKCFGRRREFHSTWRNPIFPLMWTVYPCPLPPQVSLKPTLLTQALWPLFSYKDIHAGVNAGNAPNYELQIAKESVYCDLSKEQCLMQDMLIF